MNILPTQVDLKFAAPAAAIALEAGTLVRGFYESGVETEYKGEADLVTEADRASERLIVERLHARFPGHGVFGEEGSRGQMESEYRWYIDPDRWDDKFCPSLSGLLRFMGLEHRRADLSARQDGEIVAGSDLRPDAERIVRRGKGEGSLPERPPHSGLPHGNARPRACWRPDFPRGSATRIRIYIFIRRSRCVRTACDEPGSAALDLAYTACGRFDGFWEFNLNPWDTAAGFLMVTEAGGTLTYFDGSPFQLASKEILATNGCI